ncbi:NUDIX domain-containing protein [Sphingomonas sp.]|uniref:NUDIX domain-containing protein n=1 Tax=Sphingomonas sp. TaxID=28214 RepID=UPI003B00C912
MADTDEREAIPAASLILMRAGAAGEPPDILFVERAKALRFGGGACAFPGGRVDPGDEALASLYPALSPADAAARIAALRETWEETGVAIGIGSVEGDFHAAVVAAPPDLARIAPFARWRPPASAPRRFDTRFYVAEAPVGADAVADGGETARVFWAKAVAVAAQVRAGEAHALFPTRRLLDRLALFGGAAEAAADAHATIDRIIDARVERRADGDWLCIPGDAGYPLAEERTMPGIDG